MQGHQVIFAGNIGDNVEITTNSSGKEIVKFNFFQDVNPMKQGAKNYANVWSVECWGRLAQKLAASSYVRANHGGEVNEGQVKGARIMVSGWVDMRPYHDGISNRINPTIIADEIAFSCHLGPLEVVKHVLEDMDEE